MDAISSLLAVLDTPVARRNGVYISPEECKIWIEEILKDLDNAKR